MIVVSTFAGDVQFPVTTAGWIGFMFSHVLYAAAIIGFYRSIAMVGAGAATFFVNLEPIVVIGAGYVLLGQTITPWQMVGVAIVIAALIYCQSAGARRNAKGAFRRNGLTAYTVRSSPRKRGPSAKHAGFPLARE